MSQTKTTHEADQTHEALRARLEQTQRELTHARQALEEAQAHIAREAERKLAWLAKMPHALRAPLNIIIGFSELLASNAVGPLNDEQQEFINHIAKGGHDLLTMFNALIDLTLCETGRMGLSHQQSHLTDVLESTVKLVRPLADKHNVALCIHSPAQPLVATFDPVRMEQVLFQLLSNGIRFSHPGGEVELWVQPKETTVMIHVKDHGIGILHEERHRLFQAFTQLSPDHTSGMGIGLALARHLIELHQGTIHVESLPGEGSTFRVELPLHATPNTTHL